MLGAGGLGVEPGKTGEEMRSRRQWATVGHCWPLLVKRFVFLKKNT